MQNILDQEMTRDEFEFYRAFHTMAQAQDYTALLDQYGILYKLESPSELLIDRAIVGEKLTAEVILKILPRDFSRVNQLIEQMIEEQPVPDGHYLLAFTDLELFDILEQPDQWTTEDVALARKILRSRGLEVSPEQLQRMREERYRELRRGRKGQPRWLLIYLACIVAGLLFFSPLFLLAGLGMGYYYWRDRSTDPEGRRYYTFEAETRRWGKLIFIGGVVLSVLYLGYVLVLGGGWWEGGAILILNRKDAKVVFDCEKSLRRVNITEKHLCVLAPWRLITPRRPAH